MDTYNIDSFDSQVKTQIYRLQDENTDLYKRVEPILQKIEDNKKKIQSLTSYLSISGNKEIVPSQIKTIKDQSSSIPTLIEQILKKLGREAHRNEIMELLQKEGAIIGGKRPSGTLSAHLSNDERFIKGKERGFWTLKEFSEKKGSAPQLDEAEPEAETGELGEGLKPSVL